MRRTVITAALAGALVLSGLMAHIGASDAYARDWSHRKNLPTGTVCAPTPGKSTVTCTTPGGKVYVCSEDSGNAACVEQAKLVTTNGQVASPGGGTLAPITSTDPVLEHGSEYDIDGGNFNVRRR